MSGTPKIISPGTPPLLWSSVEEAFRNINQNFNDIYATIQSDGSTQVVNFSQLYDDVSPAIINTYQLGTPTQSWKKLYVSGYNDISSDEDNGVWIGLAQIKDDSTAIVLPAGSRVGADLIIDSEKTFWKTIQVDSENFVEATVFSDTLNINSGTAMQIVVDSGAESITFNNTGVTGLAAGAGTAISSAIGNVTISNTGVLTLDNTSVLPAGLPAGSGISVDASTGNINITNTGVLNIDAGFGITVSRDNATGVVTVSNSAPAQVAFRTIRVSGSSDLVADSTSDTLVVQAGYGMVITTSEIVNDTLVLAVDQNLDILGSVFANDSSVMVDAVEQKIYAEGGFIGDIQGSVFGDDSGKIIDSVENKVYGDVYASVYSDGSVLLVDANTGKIVGPLNSTDGINSVIMDTVSGLQIVSTSLVDIQGAAGAQIGIGAGTSGNITIGSGTNQTIISGTLMAPTIDTTDSSAINIVPSVNCNSDLIVGGDILPNTDLGGNLGSPTNQWKSLYVSSSTIFIGGVPITVEGGQLSVNGSTVIGGGGGGPVTWNDVTGKPTFAAVATSGDYTDLLNPPSIPSLGSITFVGTVIDSNDSSAITFTPAVVLNSDLTIENDLIVDNDATVSGTLNVSALNVTGAITSQGSGTPELFSDNEILLTAGTRVEISSSPLKMASYTTDERDAISPTNGDVIYNTTTNKFQGYAGGTWVDLH